MAYQPEIIPSSEQGQALQAAIQKQLAFLGWSTEDDTVMAEYCLVMLGNRKTAAQISTELSDLIGADFDESFVQWLFNELNQHYPDPASQPVAAAAAPAASSAEPHNSPSTSNSTPPTGPASQTNGSSTSLPRRPIENRGSGGRNMFGNAVSGVKRDLDHQGGRDAQRQRFEGVPSGPRNGTGNGGVRNGPRNLMDRLGPSQARNNPIVPPNSMGMPPQAFEAIAQTIEAVKRGAHPSALASIPFPALASHPAAATLPPQIMAQVQAHAMAQAQAFAAMSNVWNVPPTNGAGGPPGGAFNPNAPAFNPAFGGARPPVPQGFGQGQRPPHQQQQQPPAAVVLPSKPLEEQICKHGVECSRPQCPYSHPSPVASKESGLVLSSEACEKQLECQDADCPKSHVSPAQKKSPPTTTSTNLVGQTTFIPPPVQRAAPVADPTSIPGAGQKPCKFAGACTRPGCVFLHPWDNAQTGGSTPCRYGLACTRPDCHFSHPPGRRAGRGGAGSTGGAPQRNLSATFNKPTGPTTKDGSIGAWPKEEDQHVSERLKRFAGGNSADAGPREKIIPGQTTQEDEKKVEIGIVGEDGIKKEVQPAA